MSFPRLDSHGLTTLVTRLASDIKQGHTILNNSGTAMTQRSKLKFRGVTVTDDATNDTTIVTLSNFNAFVDITTTDEELFGLSINVKKDGVSVDTTEFDNSGFVEYTVLSAGTYVFECTYDGHTYSSANVVIVAQTTYETSISMGLSLEAWITAGSVTGHTLNPSSYATFADLEADEAAIRQLMLVHDAVDYLATATAGDTLMQSVINSDICAKWINISDYAYNTLSANSDIADEMDTADKYGYGEWVENNGTWGAKGNVPIMTANNAPYGVANASSTTTSNNPAWKAFDGNYDSSVISNNDYWVPATGQSNNYISYGFINPVKASKFKVRIAEHTGAPSITFKIQGSNVADFSSDVHDLKSFTITNTETNKIQTVEDTIAESDREYYMYYRLFSATPLYVTGSYQHKIITLQFYGRELKPLVPTMTADDKPRGQASASSVRDNSNTYAAFRAFDGHDISNQSGWQDENTSSNKASWLEYDFDEEAYVQMFDVYLRYLSQSNYGTNNYSFKIEGYINNEWVALAERNRTASEANKNFIGQVCENPHILKKVRIYFPSDLHYKVSPSIYWTEVYKLQFYGFDYSEKEFAPGSTMKYIYDHGVELETLTISGTGSKGDNAITLSASGATALVSITFTSGVYSALNGKTGLNASGSPRIVCGSGYAAITDRASLDVSAITGANNTGASQTGSGTVDIEELWLE